MAKGQQYIKHLYLNQVIFKLPSSHHGKKKKKKKIECACGVLNIYSVLKKTFLQIIWYEWNKMPLKCT